MGEIIILPTARVGKTRRSSWRCWPLIGRQHSFPIRSERTWDTRSAALSSEDSISRFGGCSMKTLTAPAAARVAAAMSR